VIIEKHTHLVRVQQETDPILVGQVHPFADQYRFLLLMERNPLDADLTVLARVVKTG